MKRKEIRPQLKSSARYLAFVMVLGLILSAVDGQAQSASSMIRGVAVGDGLDCVSAWQSGSVSDRMELAPFFNRDAAGDIMTSFSGESQVPAGVGNACSSAWAFTFPLASAPTPASPELLVAGTLGLMLVGWWKIRTLEL